MGKTKIKNISGVKKDSNLPGNKDSSTNYENSLKEKIRKLEEENQKLRKEVKSVNHLQKSLTESDERYELLLNSLKSNFPL